MSDIKEKRIAIKKLVLKIGDKEISLTPDEADQLYSALGEFFEKKVIVVGDNHHHNFYPWHWNFPVVTYEKPGMHPDPNMTWCSSNGIELLAQVDKG